MKHLLILMLGSLLMLSCSEQGGYSNADDPQEFMDSVSYAIGHQMGQNMRNDSIEISVDFLAKGLKDAINESENPLMADSTMAKVRQAFNTQMQQKMQRQQQAQMQQEREKAQKNQELTGKFLEENKKEQGVNVTESGLQYKVLQEGTGESPEDNDMVKMHVVGKLPDGSTFDNTYDSGRPVTIPVNSLVQGWREAVKMMKTGGKWEIALPPDLAFGDQGVQGTIPPNSAVILEIELLKILSEEEARQEMQKMQQMQQQGPQGQMPPPGQRPPGGQRMR